MWEKLRLFRRYCEGTGNRYQEEEKKRKKVIKLEKRIKERKAIEENEKSRKNEKESEGKEEEKKNTMQINNERKEKRRRMLRTRTVRRTNWWLIQSENDNGEGFLKKILEKEKKNIWIRETWTAELI